MQLLILKSEGLLLVLTFVLGILKGFNANKEEAKSQYYNPDGVEPDLRKSVKSLSDV